MALSMKIGLAAMIAIAVNSSAGHAQSTGTDPGSTPAVDPALGQNSPDGTPYQYGVFREVVAAAPVNQRNCWVQGLVSGQTINGDLLTERVSLTQAQCVLKYLDQRGLCASQRVTPYWSARQDNTTTGASNDWHGSHDWNNGSGSNNGQNSNGSQGGDSGQHGGGWQTGGGGQHHQRSHNGDDTQNGDGWQNGDQWTRQGEWIRNGGVNPAWINQICGGGTSSGSSSGTGGGTGSGNTSN